MVGSSLSTGSIRGKVVVFLKPQSDLFCILIWQGSNVCSKVIYLTNAFAASGVAFPCYIGTHQRPYQSIIVSETYGTASFTSALWPSRGPPSCARRCTRSRRCSPAPWRSSARSLQTHRRSRLSLASYHMQLGSPSGAGLRTHLSLRP